MELTIKHVKNSKTLMKVEIDIQSDFTVDEGVRIMEQIYKDYRIRNITVQEFNDA